jgi:hypothetical protein
MPPIRLAPNEIVSQSETRDAQRRLINRTTDVYRDLNDADVRAIHGRVDSMRVDPFPTPVRRIVESFQYIPQPNSAHTLVVRDVCAYHVRDGALARVSHTRASQSISTELRRNWNFERDDDWEFQPQHHLLPMESEARDSTQAAVVMRSEPGGRYHYAARHPAPAAAQRIYTKENAGPCFGELHDPNDVVCKMCLAFAQCAAAMKPSIRSAPTSPSEPTGLNRRIRL